MSRSQPLDLEEAFFETGAARWRKLFPWLNLCDAVRLSLDPRKIVLAAVGVFVFSLLMQLANWLPFGHSGPVPTLRAWLEWIETFTFYTVSTKDVDSVPVSVSGPMVDLMQPASIAHVANVVTRLLLGLAVWTIFGGAIARITAMQFSGDHPVSTWQALTYSVRHALAGFFGPLLPLLGLLGIWVLIALGGLISQIPTVGPMVAAVFYGLAMLLGLIGTILVFGVAISWPLMIAGNAVEGTDAFDMLSRGFGYLFSRPITFLFINIIAFQISYLLNNFVLEVMTSANALAQWYFSTTGVSLWEETVTNGFAYSAHATWETVWESLAGAFSTAFFWTAVTIIYFLLRLSVDAMPLDRVFLPDSGEADDLAPLVGVPATERREQQRAEQQSAEAEPPAESTSDPEASNPEPS